MDGKDDPVMEPVVEPSAVALDEQPGPDQRRAYGLVRAELAEQPVPAGRRESELERGGNPSGQTTFLEVLHRP